jgi:multicomponent Na+:H+ antiporter subunit D
MVVDLPPFAPLFIAAALAPLLPARLRGALLLAAPLGSAWNLWALSESTGIEGQIFGYTLELYRNDGLSLLFGILFHLAAFLGGIFALKVSDRLQISAALIYAGSAIGFVFAGDLITVFIFWETMAIASAGLIWAARSEHAISAGLRYLGMQLGSGLLFLSGIILLIEGNGSTRFGAIGLDSLAGILIFVAFGIKGAFPGLHTWLTDAYPRSTPTGTVFLSAFTSKVAVYALARGYVGAEPLIYIGTAMTVFPIFYAVIENDLRRVLCYSMINQLGFMMVGIGVGTALAVSGALAHAFNEVLFKGLLFMSMGAVLKQTGKINGSDLGGLYKTMPATTGLCIVGAASISAFPLFSGFVSKALILAAVAEEGHFVLWLLLLFASAGVFHHAGIKIPFFAFFAHDSGIRTRDPDWNMLVAMGLAAALCVAIGIYPAMLYALLPFAPDFVPYTATHVVTQVQLLFFSALAFAWLKMTGLYPPELRSTNLDFDWFARRLAWPLTRRAGLAALALSEQAHGLANHFAARSLAVLLRVHGPYGVFGRTWLTGTTVLWVAALLGAYLILYYL